MTCYFFSSHLICMRLFLQFSLLTLIVQITSFTFSCCSLFLFVLYSPQFMTEYGFAHSNVLVYALVKNPAGNFIDGGDPATVSEAAASTMSSIPADLRYSITTSSGPNAYPISGTDWALVYLNQTDHDLGKALAYYMWWATHEGQKYSAELGYAPIPAELVAKDEAQIKRMMCNGSPCFP